MVSKVRTSKTHGRKARQPLPDIIELGRGRFGYHFCEDKYDNYYDSMYYYRGIPNVVFFCVEFLLANAINSEGLFRICGSVVQIAKARKLIDKGKSVALVVDNMANHDVASLLKLYLREIKPQLLSEYVCAALISAMDMNVEEVDLILVRKILLTLPLFHYNTLCYLFMFLHILHHNRDYNKMDARNISIIFTITICGDTSRIAELTKVDPVKCFAIVEHLIVYAIEYFQEDLVYLLDKDNDTLGNTTYVQSSMLAFICTDDEPAPASPKTEESAPEQDVQPAELPAEDPESTDVPLPEQEQQPEQEDPDNPRLSKLQKTVSFINPPTIVEIDEASENSSFEELGGTSEYDDSIADSCPESEVETKKDCDKEDDEKEDGGKENIDKENSPTEDCHNEVVVTETTAKGVETELHVPAEVPSETPPLLSEEASETTSIATNESEPVKPSSATELSSSSDSQVDTANMTEAEALDYKRISQPLEPDDNPHLFQVRTMPPPLPLKRHYSLVSSENAGEEEIVARLLDRMGNVTLKENYGGFRGNLQNSGPNTDIKGGVRNAMSIFHKKPVTGSKYSSKSGLSQIETIWQQTKKHDPLHNLDEIDTRSVKAKASIFEAGSKLDQVCPVPQKYYPSLSPHSSAQKPKDKKKIES